MSRARWVPSTKDGKQYVTKHADDGIRTFGPFDSWGAAQSLIRQHKAKERAAERPAPPAEPQ